MAVGASGWTALRQGIAFGSVATARTVLAVTPGKSIKITEIGVGFVGGNTGTAKPVLVELVQSDGTTAGTSTGAVTPTKTDRTNPDTVQASASYGYTAEPTVLVALKSWRIHPQATFVLPTPLGREARSDKLMGLRVTFDTAETGLNVDAYIEFEE